MKKYILTMAAMLSMTAAAYASGDDGPRQTLTVGGAEVGKTVSEIRFDGNNAVLLFADGSDIAVDMQQVRLTLDYDLSTGIGTLRLDEGADTRVYDLQGRQVGTTSPDSQLPNGVYIVNGKKYYNKKK